MQIQIKEMLTGKNFVNTVINNKSISGICISAIFII